MLSMPPATTISAEPARKRSVATIAAFIPEPHILLIVVQPAPSGRPAPSDAWRAGACPCPAGRTQPMRISSTLSAPTPARSTAAEIARAPRAGAVTSLRSPRKPPIGVRAAPTMTMASDVVMTLLRKRCRAACAQRPPADLLSYRVNSRTTKNRRSGGEARVWTRFSQWRWQDRPAASLIAEQRQQNLALVPDDADQRLRPGRLGPLHIGVPDHNSSYGTSSMVVSALIILALSR